MTGAVGPATAEVADGLPTRARLWAMLAIGIAMSMAVLDGAIVNVALPVMAKDLQVSPGAAIFITNGYQLAVTAALLPLASLGDILGYKRVYCTGLALFTAASLACALAGSLPVLVAARIVQGLGAAGIMSVNIALVRFVYPHRMIGRGVGTMALIVAIASAAGPSVAAAVLSLTSWPWLFLVNVPLGLAALTLATRMLPATPRSGARFDALSALLNALVFCLLITGVDGLGEAGRGGTALALLTAAGLVGIAFVWMQARLPAPLLPIDLLRIPVFALSMVSSVCSFSAQMMAYVALPFYFQDVLHLSSTQTGLLMTPWPIAIAVIAPFAGRLADRYPPGLLGAIGLVALSAGLALMASLPAEASPLAIAWRLTLCGLGFGLFQSPNNKVIITSAPRERSGGASGMQSTARLLGQSLGAAVVAVIFGHLHAGGTATVLWLSSALALTGALASGLRVRR
ncbi:multidrug MFS transporter [Methylobacterium indicum]|uniref:MFS transporter n=1 Tax=Methylobacterium indicum TaxID=1775910 RepID=UPI000733CEC0|nr:MFS transporter [Methylobacterium indicum]KTS38801.1 multidrug MFS transporter [Methylobacterium indicum]KTS42859.1 multidrug MFS transporter [Methylobacterium indicum]KTS52984.1 multidrug MFS transporter [Methylobacterium indicum]